jgi:hypothetical protein
MNEFAPFRREDPVGRWSVAVAEVCFPIKNERRPVYLSPSDDELLKISAAAGEPVTSPEEALDGLFRAVATTLHSSLEGTRRARVFARYRVIGMMYRQLHGPSTEPPPNLALLALLGRAARMMGGHGEFSSLDFYGPLASMLRLPTEKAWLLGNDYRHDADEIWFPLPHWLASCDGLRGTSTVQSFGAKRYISVPLSQAIFTEADAGKIVEFMDGYGFNALDVPTDDELRVALEAWVDSEGSGCPRRVRDLWVDRDARETIVGVIRANINGHRRKSFGTESGRKVALTIVFEGSDGKVPYVGLSVRLTGEGMEPDEVPVIFGSRQRRGALVRAGDGSYILEHPVPAATGVRDLLGAGFSVVRASDRASLATHRAQESLYVFVRDGVRESFTETRSISRGAESLLVCEVTVSSQIQRLLEDAADPGWTRNAMPGAPGWQLYERVFIRKRSPLAAGKYSALQPHTRKGLFFSGGIELGLNPRNGAAGTWLVSRPPIVSTVNEDGNPLTCTIFRVGHGTDAERVATITSGPDLRIAMQDVVAEPGIYEVTVETSQGGAYAPVRIDLVGLTPGKEYVQSAYQPAVASDWPISAALVHGSETIDIVADNPIYVPEPLWAKRSEDAGHQRAVDVEDEGFLQEGTAIDYGDDVPFAPGMMLQYGSSVGQFRNAKLRDGIRHLEIAFPKAGRSSRDGDVTVLLPESRWDSVAAAPDGARPGFQKAGFAPRPIEAAMETKPAAWESEIQVGQLVRILPVEAVDDKELGDAIACMSEGVPSDLMEIARIAHPNVGATFAVSLLLARLEAEGRVNIARDDAGMPTRWYSAAPALIEGGDGELVLLGSMAPSELAEVDEKLGALGWRQFNDHMPVIRWRGGRWEGMPLQFTLHGGAEFRLLHGHLQRILESLPRISRVLNPEAPLFELSEVRQLERWNGPMPREGEWQPVDLDEVANGNLVRGYGTLGRVHGLVSDEARMRLTQSDLGKLAVGARLGWNLAQYSDQHGLVLPGSIQLPGLYGRVVRLASIKRPSRTKMIILEREYWMSTYPGINQSNGQRIAALLNS